MVGRAVAIPVLRNGPVLRGVRGTVERFDRERAQELLGGTDLLDENFVGRWVDRYVLIADEIEPATDVS